jgi:UDP-3-O-[3-hydroxymyristoyl] glucosamine N-acyltransferase
VLSISAHGLFRHDIADGRKISGSPEFDNREWLRCTAVYRRLPEIDKTVRKLKAKLDAESQNE